MSSRYPLYDMSPAERALYLAARQRVEFTRIRDENGQPTDDLIEIYSHGASRKEPKIFIVRRGGDHALDLRLVAIYRADHDGNPVELEQLGDGVTANHDGTELRWT